MHRFRLACLALFAALCGLPAPASADIYVASQSPARVWVTPITGGSYSGSISCIACTGVATDSHYVYTVSASRIMRTSVSTNAQTTLVSGISGASSVAVDADHVYWYDGLRHAIGRANLDGTQVDRLFIPSVTSAPGGIAVDAGHIYWTDTAHHEIGRASIDGSGADPNFMDAMSLTSDGPMGVAVTGDHIYYSAGPAILSASIEGYVDNIAYWGYGSGPVIRALAADGTHLYFTYGYPGTSIGRMPLDDYWNVDEYFVSYLPVFSSTAIRQMAVSAPVAPAFHDYGAGTVGEDASQTFTFTNVTSSSTVSVSAIDVAGPGASSYAVVDETCTTAGALAPADSCTATVAVVPGTDGALPATLRFLSDQPDSPHVAYVSGTGVYATPEVTMLAPANGTVAGRTAVHVGGAHLTGATAVTFGGVPATSFQVDSDASLTAVTPAGTLGPAAVVVTAPGGSSDGALSFAYEPVPPPALEEPASPADTTDGPAVDDAPDVPAGPFAAPAPLTGQLIRSGRAAQVTWTAPAGVDVKRYVLAWSLTHTPLSPADDTSWRIYLKRLRTDLRIRAWPGSALMVSVFAYDANGRVSRPATISFRA